MKVIENASLSSYNSFHLEVKAKFLVIIEDEEDLREAFCRFSPLHLPYYILGGGSNTLFTRDYSGIILLMAIRGVSHTQEADHFEVEAKAGENWNELVQYCLRNQIGGLENLSLIPGTVGASPVQNIGAYGVELKDSFFKLRAFEISTQKFKDFHYDQCAFSYRESVFKTELKGQYIICSVYFRFPRKPILHTQYGSIQMELEKEGITNPDIQDISRVVSRIRQEKLPDPKTIGNAGSFFKNPMVSQETLTQLILKYPDIVHYPHGDQFKLAAGWLIEKCGWKGKSIGNVGTWKNQALVLVNLGNAQGDEILEFAEAIVRSVQEKFHISLEMEVNII
jgi:UDP-N-acetylmuramate dehydrogenase